MSKKHKALKNISHAIIHSAKKVTDSGILLPLVDRLSNINDEHVEALYALGYDFFHGKKYREAETIFYFICQLNHMEKKYWKALAVTFFLQKKYPSAQAAYFTSLMLDPTDVEMMSAMADCAIAMGNVPDADNLLAATAEMSDNYQQRLDLGQRAKALLEMLRGQITVAENNPDKTAKPQNKEIL
jgi:type III secretion system low calcium response chaperone LcrH/SycD